MRLEMPKGDTFGDTSFLREKARKPTAVRASSKR
jgi:hypothetical protein